MYKRTYYTLNFSRYQFIRFLICKILIFFKFKYILITCFISKNRSSKICITAVSWAAINEFFKSCLSFRVFIWFIWLTLKMNLFKNFSLKFYLKLPFDSLRTIRWFSTKKNSIWFLLANKHSFSMYKITSKRGPHLN